MSLVAKLYTEDKEINILDFKFRFTRSTDEHGKPMGKPNGTIFEIVFETTADQSFMEWSIATDMTKHVKIVVSPVTGMSKSRTIELYDVHCVFFKNDFNSRNGEPMSTLIHLTPAIMVDEGYKVLDHYWKKTDLSVSAPITTVEPEKQPVFVESYYENKQGERIPDEEVKIGDEVNLVLKTKDAVNKKITVSLQDEAKDFEYEGKRLENDLLENITISADVQRIALKVLPQEETQTTH